jgi:hypothetical protein
MVYYEKGIVVKTAAPAVLMPLPKISHVSQFVRYRNYFIDVFQKKYFIDHVLFPSVTSSFRN